MNHTRKRIRRKRRPWHHITHHLITQRGQVRLISSALRARPHRRATPKNKDNANPPPGRGSAAPSRNKVGAAPPTGAAPNHPLSAHRCEQAAASQTSTRRRRPPQQRQHHARKHHRAAATGQPPGRSETYPTQTAINHRPDENSPTPTNQLPPHRHTQRPPTDHQPPQRPDKEPHQAHRQR